MFCQMLAVGDTSMVSFSVIQEELTVPSQRPAASASARWSVDGISLYIKDERSIRVWQVKAELKRLTPAALYCPAGGDSSDVKEV